MRRYKDQAKGRDSEEETEIKSDRSGEDERQRYRVRVQEKRRVSEEETEIKSDRSGEEERQ